MCARRIAQCQYVRLGRPTRYTLDNFPFVESLMTNKYKSGISDVHLVVLTDWLRDNYKEAPIETSETAYLVSLEAETTLARRMCKLAAARYEKKRPLYFLPVQSKISMARALWLGDFDAVIVTAPLIREIQALATKAASMACDSALRPGTGCRSRFSRIGTERLQQPSASNVLQGLLTQGMFAFLIGHEIGHLAGGHLGVIQAYRHPRKAEAPTGAIGAIDDAAGEPDVGDPKVAVHLNAIEVDADVQACDFLERHWTWVCNNAKKSLLEADPDKRLAAEIFTVLLDSPESRFFISMVCMTSMIALLGLGDFDPTRLLRKTHPVSATRVITAMRTLTCMCSLDPVARLDLYRNESAEAISFVHCVLGSILIQARKYDQSNPVAQQLALVAPAERLAFLLAQTGIQGAIESMEDIRLHTQTLAAAFNKTLRIRIPHRRFAHDELVRWDLPAPATSS